MNAPHSVIADSSSGEETLSRLRKFYVTMRSEDRDAFLLITEAQLYAVRFRAKLAALFRRVHNEIAASLRHLRDQICFSDLAPAPHLALISLAANHGLMLYYLINRMMRASS
jgi:hypothetical protein